MKTSRKFIALLVAMCVLVGLLSVVSLAEVNPPQGAGTEPSPYQISTKDELIWLQEYINGSEYDMSEIYVELTADIDLNPGLTFNADGTITGDGIPFDWSPMGYVEESLSSMKAFVGRFDGKGHTIKGLYMNETADSGAAGFIGYLAGEVKNLNFDNLYISSRSGMTGGVAGVIQGVIDNCHVNGTIISKRPNVEYINGTGGIVGNVNSYGSEVTSCSFKGLVDCVGDVPYTAGIVGDNFYGYIADCVNYGTVKSVNDKVGGIVANMQVAEQGNDLIDGKSSYILRCENYGDISSTCDAHAYVGGIVGMSSWSSTLDYVAVIGDCLNMGTITGNASGGIAGYLETVTKVENCYNGGNVEQNSSGDICGALVGIQLAGCPIVNSFYLQNDTVNAGLEPVGNVGHTTQADSYIPTPDERIDAEDAKVTSEQAASGEIAYKLNGSRTDLVWKQNLDNGEPKDDHPQLKGGNVYLIDKYATCDRENPADSVKVYSNTNEAIYTEHTFSSEWTIDKEADYDEDGEKSHHCTVCDERTDITKIPQLERDDGNPSTGDENNVVLWSTILFMSCALLLVAFICKKKKVKE